MLLFSGKTRLELYSQPNSLWTNEMYQESGGEPHHWTSFQRDGCHVSGTCSQVNDSNKIWINKFVFTIKMWFVACNCPWLHLLSETCLWIYFSIRHYHWGSCSHHWLKISLLSVKWLNDNEMFFVFTSLSRYKLKFSPDKVDTMIVQAICKSFCSCLHPFIMLGLTLAEIELSLWNKYFKLIASSKYTFSSQ